MTSLNNALFKKLIIKFVDELSQNDFEIVRNQVQRGSIDNVNGASNGANYSFRVIASNRIDGLPVETYNERYWRNPFEKLIQIFVYSLSGEDFQLLHEGVKNDTWGFVRLNTWISTATYHRIRREKEINLPEMRNALVQLEMIGQKLDQICIKIPSFLEIDEFERRNLLGLLNVSTKNVFSAEERLATNLEILEKEEN